MKIPLSKRLLACCDFVRPGERVADIGCDHGYLGIYLLKNGIADSVIASDINKAPLQSAVRNSEKFGVGDKIQFCLSDGVKDIPRDFDALVCAGMGGDTMVSILSAAPWLKDKRYRLILQCQSKTPLLRQYLYENGWGIEQETVLRDGRFLYTVMVVSWKDCLSPASMWEFYYPAVLLEAPTSESVEYYYRAVKKLQISVTGHGAQADKKEVIALEQLKDLANRYTFLREETQ